jgi:hypothetical protein
LGQPECDSNHPGPSMTIGGFPSCPIVLTTDYADSTDEKLRAGATVVYFPLATRWLRMRQSSSSGLTVLIAFGKRSAHQVNGI